ncbi:MAG: class I SAM-dependent methyltransferase [Candidatus Latescibacterota bacterium]|jgi:SAM-dependent methyltransferase
MNNDKTAKEVFEAWGNDYHADGMETEHWPRVRRIFDLIPPSDGDFLEIGVGNGYGLAYMATRQFSEGRCLGMDLSESMVVRAQERTRALGNADVCAGDFLTWDFGERRFDVVFSMEVFYYFDDVAAGTRKAWSILKPGGTLWVAVNYYAENLQSAGWPDLLGTSMQRLSKGGYAEGFARAGFTAVEQRMIEAPVPEGSKHGDEPTLLTFGRRP